MPESSCRHVKRIAAVALLALLVAACAPDAWRASQGADAFYGRIEKNCGTMRLGEASVDDLMGNGPGQSPAFLDAASRFQSDRMSAGAFANAVASSARVSPDHPAISCIIAQKMP